MKIKVVMSVLALALSAAPSPAATILSKDFNDGDLSAWYIQTNYVGSVGKEIDTSINGSNDLGVYLNAPPGGLALNVRANLDFITTSVTNANLSFLALTVPCTGCTISYQAWIDFVVVASGSTNGAVANNSISLGNLSAGSHTLTLAMLTSNASSGHFLAEFDNVLIAGDAAVAETPLPAALPLFATGLGALGLMRWRRKRKAVVA